MTEPKTVFTNNGYLERNLVKMEETLVEDKDKDMIILVIGQPGTSKSSLTLMMQLALRGKVNFDDICFTHEQYMESCKEGGKNKVIQYDEGRNSFYKRRAMQNSNTESLDMLNQYRFKNHVHFINFQNLTDMELDLIYKRSHAIIRTTSQGFFHFYNKNRAQKIDVDKDKRTVDWPNPNFTGRFPDPANEYPEIWEKYNKVNEEKIIEDEEDGTDWEKKYRRLRKKIAKTFVTHLDMQQQEATEQLDLTKQAYTEWKKNGNLTNIPPFDISDSVNKEE